MARARTYRLWFLGGLILLVLWLAALAFTSAVQTAAARFALKKISAGWPGEVTVQMVGISWDGRFRVCGLVLRGEDGSEIAALDSLDGLLRVRALLRDSLHVLDLSARGLALNLAVDSSGTLNLLRAVASESKPKAAAERSPWAIRVDSLRIRGRATAFAAPPDVKLAFNSWTLRAAGSFADDSLRGQAVFDIPSQLSLDVAGSLVLREVAPQFSARVGVRADSLFLSALPPPARALGDVSLSAHAATRTDSLDAEWRIESRNLGTVAGAACVPYPLRDFAGRAQVEFADLALAPLLSDTIPTRFSGRLSVTKCTTPSPLNGWRMDLDLRDSRYDSYHLRVATLHAHSEDSTAILTGQFDTGRGTAEVDARLAGFDPARAHLTARVRTRTLNLHSLVQQIPNSLSPLTADIRVQANSLDPDHPDGDITLSLSPTAFGSLALDTVFLAGGIRDRAFHLDTLAAAGMGSTVGLCASGERGGEMRFNGTVSAPNLSRLQLSLAPFLPIPDTLTGRMEAQFAGTASLAGDSLSDVMVAGRASLDSIRYGDSHTASARLLLDHADLERLHFRGSLEAHAISVAGHDADSLRLAFDGTPRDIAAQFALRTRGDTLAVTADLTAHIEPQQTNVTLLSFSATAFGIPWELEGETAIHLQGNRLDVDGLQLRSPLGVLRAAGTLERGGEQDLVVELSGFRTGEIARVFNLPVPESWINARVQFTGPDTALFGDLSVSADSVTLDGQSLADHIELHATVDEARTVLDGWLSWLGDTLTVFEGELPARLSAQQGLVVSDSLPMSGRVRVLPQSLSKLDRYLPFGQTLSGTVAADVTFSGTPAEPRWNGVFSVADGRYRDTRFGVDYRNLTTDGELVADTLRIARFNATSTGTLTGSGWAVMAFPLPSELHLDLTFDRFEAVNGPMMRARATGHISADGPPARLTAAGEVKVEEALYRITQATGKQIEEIDLNAELARLRGDTAEPSLVLTQFYRPMAHQIRVELPGNCWVRGGGVNLELQGSLWLYKEPFEPPAVNGEITVREGGKVEFLGRELRVLSGSVRYEGPLENPAVDIAAYLPRPPLGVDSITARISGTLLQSRMDLSGKWSDGRDMTPEDIVMQLVGSGVNLFQADSVSVAGKMENVFTTAASSQLSNMVGRLAGLDVFEFHAGAGGLSDLSGGSLEIGTYVTNRLFVQVLQPIKTTQTGQKVSVEYRLFDWLKLRAQQTGRESSAFDLYLQFDWR